MKAFQNAYSNLKHKKMYSHRLANLISIAKTSLLYGKKQYL